MPALLANDFSDWWIAVPWDGLRVWGTFFAVGIGALFALGAYRREARRDRAREKREIAEQASKVAAWVLIEEGLVRIRNASDLPVSNVSVWIGKHPDPDDAASQQRRDRRKAGWTLLTSSMRAFAALNHLPPAETGHQHEEIQLGRLISRYGRNPRIGLFFRDAQGVMWVRVDGRLFNDDEESRSSWWRTLIRKPPADSPAPPAISQSEI